MIFISILMMLAGIILIIWSSLSAQADAIDAKWEADWWAKNPDAKELPKSVRAYGMTPEG